jgi:hypothetical protein
MAKELSSAVGTKYGPGKLRLDHSTRKIASMWAIGHLHVKHCYKSVCPQNHVSASEMCRHFITLLKTILTITTFELKNSVLWPTQGIHCHRQLHDLLNSHSTPAAKPSIPKCQWSRTAAICNRLRINLNTNCEHHTLVGNGNVTYRIYRQIPKNGFATLRQRVTP